ncbi:CdaR family transcriptional regulator [Heyndrickxia coagulans]|uniref:CdaR family transcriptional regulator n=1 Tax=Heyndrickxia coagulans TaxID=1398 RepID=UPI00034751D8|nr:sugar diacid recognition domain-containing protein [Heyndrickxia coagulans]UZH06063.1 helix-turn-helix domain-containing protein [Heyndrickxia coagulans]
MSKWLTRELAQKIVEKMMQDIPYSINIMNEKGIIIGSGNKNRVGTLHRGAVQALESGKMVEIFHDNRFEKKGTNEPIVIGDQSIGVIGITGEPKEVRPFCRLVKTAVSLLIEQNILLGNREAEKNREVAFLEALLNEKKAYSQQLINEAEYYHIHLHVKNSVILIKHAKKRKEIELRLKSFPFFKKQNENTYILILQNEKDVEKVAGSILHIDQHAVVAAGLHGLNIAASFRQARLCMLVCEKLHLSNRFFTYEDWKFPAELSQINFFPADQKQVFENLSLPDLLLQTLMTFIDHNGNPTETARALMIHRNTLYYRLNRIEQLTGKNPNQMMDLFELIYLLLRQ